MVRIPSRRMGRQGWRGLVEGRPGGRSLVEASPRQNTLAGELLRAAVCVLALLGWSVVAWLAIE